MSRSTEHERIALLKELFASELERDVTVSIGDDAAVLPPGGASLVWSIDAAVEGTHFRRDLMTLADAGFRATMAALSDLAAMGAEPAGVLSSLVLPADLADEDLLELASGQRQAADACRTALIGGNLARGDVISITTTVLGRAKRPLTRSGARPGDGIWVSGDLGWAAAGLASLLAGGDQPPRAVAAFRRPEARISAGLVAAAQGATAAVDVSDGLVADISHLAVASGVRAVLDEAALADDALDTLAAGLGRSGLRFVLAGGEDYALVVTTRAASLPGFRHIGACEGGSPGVALRSRAGTVEDLVEDGFDHFASASKSR